MSETKNLALVLAGCLAVLGCVSSERGEEAPPALQTPSIPSGTATDRADVPIESRPTVVLEGSVVADGAPIDTPGPDGPVTAPDVAEGMAFDLGRQLGEQTARSAWQSLGGGCDAVEKVTEVIRRSSGRILSGAGRFAKSETVEYAEGYVLGMRTGLAEIAGKCTERCSLLCEAATQAATTLLCEAARTVGGTPSLRHAAEQPQIPCASGNCGAPASINLADCP